MGEADSEANLLIRTRQGKNLGGASKITSYFKKDLTVEVRLVTIDQVIPSDRTVSVIHLDVEGYEKQDLVGALHTIQHYKPLIIMEDNNDIINTE